MTISRRTLMQAVAAAPLASVLQPKTRMRVVVIGAGAFGGWTALHLRRAGAEVTLVDAWGAGNSRSSSGGETRVIRAVYGPDRIYVEMVKRAYELWTEVEVEREPLYVETGTLWMHRGDDAYVRSSIPVLTDLGFVVEQLSLDAAKRRYPQIDFAGVKSVWLEHRAGVLSARRACAVVRDAFERSGGSYRVAQAEPPAIERETLTSLTLGDGSHVEADAFVFACGPWLGRLFPEVIGEAVRPTRQEVFFFGTPRGSTRYLPAAMPVWIDFGERIFYGIPDTHGRGFKLADDTRGETIDPTSMNRVPSNDALARARALLAERFPELANAPLVESRVCQYENSPDGHLILDRHPHAKNVWLVGGGSGHGFKLSPAVGEIAANAVMGANAPPPLFSLARLKDAKHATQFGTKN